MTRTQKRLKKKLPPYTFRGCPLTKNASPTCWRLCTPKTDGEGFCGRVAPHGMEDRIQAGIRRHKKKARRT